VSEAVSSGALALELAPDPVLLAAARLFAAASARLAGCNEEAVEDVRLAVSEACTRAMRRAASGSEDRIRVETRSEGDVLTVEVLGPASEAPAASVDDPAIDLVTALFPDAAESVHDGAVRLRFSAPRS
jgi:anti-sigma regulatory factor (Ser/Thr protein kinase)